MSGPLIVSPPDPSTVPPESVTLDASALVPLKFDVPPEMTRVPAPELPAVPVQVVVLAENWTVAPVPAVTPAEPLCEPPPVKLMVPDVAETVPALLNVQATALVAVPPVFWKVPALVKVPVPPLIARPASLARVNVAPALFVHAALAFDSRLRPVEPVKVAVLPEELMTVWFRIRLAVAVFRPAPPLSVTVPDPLSVPPVQVNRLLTFRFDPPPITPPPNVKLLTVMTALSVGPPELTVAL